MSGVGARHRIEYAGYRLGGALVRRLPLERVQRIAERGASRVFAREGRRARWTLANLKIAFPERSEAERREIGRQSYVHFAWNAIDWLRAESWGPDDYLARVEVRGVEHLQEALARGRGAIALSLHMGNFELAGGRLPLSGISIAAVGRTLRNPLLYARIAESRTRLGAKLIDRTGALRGMLRALRDGCTIAVLNDQYGRRSRGILAPFFGARCYTTPGVAIVALRTGAPVLPIYAIRLGPDRHAVVFQPPLEPPATGDRAKDVEAATVGYNAVLERLIRANPEQWMWGHRRFRYSPDLDYDPYAG